jgi:tRNA-2-methylthio-N6-dimethylallyladenosine synthase
VLFHIHTYGCQMNERDSEIAADLLRQHGHRPAADEASADLVIVNTCSVRGKAEDKAIGKLRLLLASRRRRRPRLLVGVIGCMVQRQGPAIIEDLPGLDFAISPQHLDRLPAAVAAADIPAKPCVEISPAAGPPLDLLQSTLPRNPSGPSAFLNILYGCNRHCAYCIVPSVRGPEYSRPPNDILAEARQLLVAGVREITLLGQSVMRYGKQPAFDYGPAPSPRGFTEPLPRLLEELAALPGLVRLRFTSGHPSGCTRELARAMAELPPVCEHMHMPVQSGSDRILRLMRRGYTADDFRQAAQRLRAAAPGLALTTDIIVGFPSETPEDFAATLALMEDVGFDNAFIFKYSPRPNTPAAEMPDDVSAAEKLRRNHALIEAQNRRTAAVNDQLIGKTLEVLVEGPSRRNPARWAGRTRTNKIVLFTPPPGTIPGDLIQVRVERATTQALYGRAQPAI